jgi:hypothetical protein
MQSQWLGLAHCRLCVAATFDRTKKTGSFGEAVRVRLASFLDSEATVYWLPFSDSTLSDPISGRNGGILERNAMLACARSATSRYRKQAQSLRIVTDTSGADIAMPDEVRLYAVSRVSHAPFRP